MTLTQSCQKSDQQIRSELRNIVNKQVIKRSAALRPDLDSLCLLNQPTQIRHAVDSIWEIRKAEIIKISQQ